MAVTGSNNHLAVSCPGMTKEQLLAILKTIKQNQINPQDAITALRQIQTEVSNIRSLIPVMAGELFPASDPDPSTLDCKGPIPSDALKVFLGPFVVYGTGASFTALRLAGQPVLSFERSSTGTLLISATVKSLDGRIIAQLVSGRFSINPSNYFRAESDKSSLTVYDQQGEVALKVRYLNPHSALVEGYFASNGRSIVLKDDVVKINNAISIHGGCAANTGTVFGLD